MNASILMYYIRLSGHDLQWLRIINQQPLVSCTETLRVNDVIDLRSHLEVGFFRELSASINSCQFPVSYSAN